MGVGLAAALGLGEREAVSFVGAGGKTTLLMALARELSERVGRGDLIISTTTTKVFEPLAGEADSLALGEPEELLAAVDSAPATWRHLALARARLGPAPVPGSPGEERVKLEGVEPLLVRRLREHPRVRAVLVEADGARGLPLKAPSPDEPVIPEASTWVLAVAGADALGAPLDEAHIFRARRAMELGGLPEGSPVGEELIARLLEHPEGFFRGAPAGARRALCINKVDVANRFELAREIGYSINARVGAIEVTLLTSAREREPVYERIGGRETHEARK